MKRLRVAWLPDGKRLHLQNGSLNLIIQAFGPPSEVGQAYNAAIERARALVLELTEDVPRLQGGLPPCTAVGLHAAAACAQVPGALGAVTALTGAVADEVLAAMKRGGLLDRAFVNNHGSVAFHLAEGHSISPHAMDWQEFSRYEMTTLAIPATVQTRGLAAGGWFYDGFAFGYVDRIYTAAKSCAEAEAVLGSIALRMRPDNVAGAVPAAVLAPHSMLGGLAVYPPLQNLPASEVAVVMTRGKEAAAELRAPNIATLVLIELGEENFLAAPPEYNLRSLLSVQV